MRSPYLTRTPFGNPFAYRALLSALLRKQATVDEGKKRQGHDIGEGYAVAIR